MYERSFDSAPQARTDQYPLLLCGSHLGIPISLERRHERGEFLTMIRPGHRTTRPARRRLLHVPVKPAHSDKHRNHTPTLWMVYSPLRLLGLVVCNWFMGPEQKRSGAQAEQSTQEHVSMDGLLSPLLLRGRKRDSYPRTACSARVTDPSS